MKRSVLFFISLLVSGLSFSQGNQEQVAPIACPTEQNFKTIVTKQATPDYVYADMVMCIREKTPETRRMAFMLYGLAGSMIIYDMDRVSDKSAHAIGGVLQYQLSQDDEVVTALKELPAVYNDPEEKQKLCQQLKTIAPPSYVPHYMLNHGLAVMTKRLGGFGGDSMDAFVPAKSPQKAWHQTIDSYLKC